MVVRILSMYCHFIMTKLHLYIRTNAKFSSEVVNEDKWISLDFFLLQRKGLFPLKKTIL